MFFNRKNDDDVIKTFEQVTGYERRLTPEQKLFAETGEYVSDQIDNPDMYMCGLCGGLVPLSSGLHPHTK